MQNMAWKDFPLSLHLANPYSTQEVDIRASRTMLKIRNIFGVNGSAKATAPELKIMSYMFLSDQFVLNHKELHILAFDECKQNNYGT